MFLFSRPQSHLDILDQRKNPKPVLQKSTQTLWKKTSQPRPATVSNRWNVRISLSLSLLTFLLTFFATMLFPRFLQFLIIIRVNLIPFCKTVEKIMFRATHLRRRSNAGHSLFFLPPLNCSSDRILKCNTYLYLLCSSLRDTSTLEIKFSDDSQ